LLVHFRELIEGIYGVFSKLVFFVKLDILTCLLINCLVYKKSSMTILQKITAYGFGVIQ